MTTNVIEFEQYEKKPVKGTELSYRNISKHFNDNKVLDNLNLIIESGEFVAIVGRSGCGKSTLLRLTAELEQASNGDIHRAAPNKKISGNNPSGDTRFMFQDARLLPWKTVLDNIGLGLAGQWQDTAKQVLQQVGLLDKADVWPATLSGGQRQRVALARALVHHPNLLLLDEPLGALDALTRIEMQQLIENLWQNNSFTAILVTHDVQEAIALADRILLIEDGKIGLDLHVNLPRPRQRGSVAFAELESTVLQRVLQQPAKAELPPIPEVKTISQLKWAW
ncbi:MAG TPA: ATP-binding cassette domain-containing protein [Pseudomonadales bacterium]|nr:ATP-binding cassette domain-containing protein [Pseudomonadales bacterium]